MGWDSFLWLAGLSKGFRLNGLRFGRLTMNGSLELPLVRSLSKRSVAWATTAHPSWPTHQPRYICGVKGCVLIAAEGDWESHILTCVPCAQESAGLECHRSSDVGA